MSGSTNRFRGSKELNNDDEPWRKQQASPLRAECLKMCPDDEFKLRTENNMVNILEKQVFNSKLEYHLVKEYSRPAAGKIIRSKHLRPVHVLVDTVKHLLNNVYNRGDVDFYLRYEFIFDRLRSIRQDLIIQRLTCESNDDVLFILKVILKFYLLVDYKLCMTSSYDPFINNQHFTEVLHQMVSSMMRKQKQKQQSLLSQMASLSLSSTNENKEVKQDESDTEIFVSIYLLTNLNNSLTSNRILKEFSPRKSFLNASKFGGKIYRLSIQICKCYLTNQFVDLFRLYKRLPLICQLALHPRIVSMQIEMLNRYNLAFSFKNSKFPVDHLIEIALINSQISLNKYVTSNLIELDETNENILFSKSKQSNQIKEEREYLNVIDEKLSKIKESEFILTDLNK